MDAAVCRANECLANDEDDAIVGKKHVKSRTRSIIVAYTRYQIDTRGSENWFNFISHFLALPEANSHSNPFASTF